VQVDEREGCKFAFLQSFVKPTTGLICTLSLLFPQQRIPYPQSWEWAREGAAEESAGVDFPKGVSPEMELEDIGKGLGLAEECAGVAFPERVSPETELEDIGNVAAVSTEGSQSRCSDPGTLRRRGQAKDFGVWFELGKEVGRGHFGHTRSAKGSKGELKG
jgi:hypothetical protein